MYSTSLTSPKGATAFTKSLNAAALADLPFHDKQDFTDAHRGFIMDFPDRKIFRDDLNSQGTSACAVNMNDYNFIDRHHSAPGPATVHPSLWRQAQLNSLSGLFKRSDLE
ncbi:hypothetical protein K7432_016763 [Basidiobolus ranarum]|uniref:Uncharacterized protein n=1 Tax=Basidiobolus ranarum TaxID=34480 RepID=A0ABR2VM90_9FUNG